MTENKFVSSLQSKGSAKRREIKDKTASYRIGPAPVNDSILSTKTEASSPGSLDSDMDDIEFDETNNSLSKAGCKGLLMYFSKLGHSTEDSSIDIDFVESLLRGGADINFSDKHGQCAMHEIARGWNIISAIFVKEKGAEINKEDKYGRTPLHLAAAVNHYEMVEWLIKNGAIVDAFTKGENQTPLHYAAKNNAVDSVRVLLNMGADIGARDYKSRTALFVAAETGRSQASRFLLEQGAPAGIYDDGGTSLLVLLIEKMPDVAKLALGQFHLVDKALRKQYFYLNYLELDVWRKMATKGGKAMRTSFARTPLETICIYNENELIMHPVILQLIAIKWNLFGKFYSTIDVVLNFTYTLLWTSLGVSLPRTFSSTSGYYTPIKSNIWRIIIEIICSILATYFIIMQIIEFRRTQKRDSTYKQWRIREVERDLTYSHPRWPEERRYLMTEMENIRSSNALAYWKNGWNIFEWVAFFSVLLVAITRFAAIISGKKSVHDLHSKTFPLLLIILWLRFMKCCRCYQSLGPFITMLGHVIADTAKFAFLFFEFFIPYVCAFWILFGGLEGTEFETFNDLVNQVFLMTIVAGYDVSDLMKKDKIMAQVLSGTYMTLASVVCLNLYIALMSETFNRVYGDATATAYMLQANRLMDLERSLGAKKKNSVKRFMTKECSPQVVYETGGGNDDDDDEEQQTLMLYRLVDTINIIKEKVINFSSEADSIRCGSKTLALPGTSLPGTSDQTINTLSGEDFKTQLEFICQSQYKHATELNEIRSLIASLLSRLNQPELQQFISSKEISHVNNEASSNENFDENTKSKIMDSKINKEDENKDDKINYEGESSLGSQTWDDKIAALTNQINEREQESVRKQKEQFNNYSNTNLVSNDSDKKVPEYNQSLAFQKESGIPKNIANNNEVHQYSNQPRFPNKFSSLPRNISLKDRSDMSNEYYFPTAPYQMQEFPPGPNSGFIDQRMYPQMFYGSNHSLPQVPYFYPPFYSGYPPISKVQPQDNLPSPQSSESSKGFQSASNISKQSKNQGNTQEKSITQEQSYIDENEKKNNSQNIYPSLNRYNSQKSNGSYSDNAPLLQCLTDDSDTSNVSTKKRRRRRRKSSIDEHAC
ncbi:uncharacterized protein LOC100208925 isoform X1 [Hydra vulgaris]|uniref:Uncharacterized protein LOC100208925 isoform X1 n=2 Tax=Hydra vulgaris TaxID=6087 RepID=A0ABM4CN51_HYDVU